MEELNLKIYGDIQDVSFRYHTKQKAEELGLTGWVRNEDDQTVQLVAQGKRSDLDELLHWCTVGPEKALVKKLEPRWGKNGKRFSVFEIRH